MEPDRSFSLTIVVFCNLPLILLSGEPLWGMGVGLGQLFSGLCWVWVDDIYGPMDNSDTGVLWSLCGAATMLARCWCFTLREDSDVCYFSDFYPRDAILARVFVVATCMSVCPSCPSVCH